MRPGLLTPKNREDGAQAPVEIIEPVGFSGQDVKVIEEHYQETNSKLSKKIIDNFNKEILNFIQVCPKEMINKLENSITNKINIQEVG